MIAQITYTADMVSPDGESSISRRFTEWVKSEIQSRYPNTVVKVVEYALPSHIIVTNDDLSGGERLTCQAFLSELELRFCQSC